MLLKGKIREELLKYDEADRQRWQHGDAPWLVTQPERRRFMYCRWDDDSVDFGRTHFSPPAWFISQRRNLFELVWHERYKLAEARSSGHFAPGNKEIFSLMGAEVARRLQAINAAFPIVFGHLPKPETHSKVIFKDPDVVAYGGGCWGIYETKRENEKMGFLQLQSLAILQHVVPNVDVACIRLVQDPTARVAKPVPYEFEFPDNLWPS